MPQPNMIFILSDQQRWDTCGCYGQPMDTTPNLDQMAQQGVRFEHAFTPQPVCGPARACLQTGKYPLEVGAYTNGRMLPRDEKTLAQWLTGADYEVGYIGKWHLASSGPRGGSDDFKTKPIPADRRGGYTDFWIASDLLEFTSHSYDGHMFDADMNRREFPPNRYRVDAQTDWVLEYLETRDRRRPFFLFVSYLEPHHQNDHQHYEGPRGSKERFGNFVPPGDLVDLDGDWRVEYPDYLGCVNSLDRNLGRIRDHLAQLGLGQNTLIVYTSDHGSHFRTRNGEYKRSCHEGCIRIPMIIHGPGFGGGKVIKELVSLIDLPPTILTAAGIQTPDYMRGKPLQGLSDGNAKDWPKEVFLQISESHCGRAIRSARWKYSVRAPERSGQDPDSEVYAEDFLYDLKNDPHEQRNLVSSSEYTEIRQRLSQILKRRMVQAGEQEPTIRGR
jgi:arylsulfatase A-like enzyme